MPFSTKICGRGRPGIFIGGLTYWTPNVNIFRDPRWGRGQETYGEDPYLTAKMGSAIVRGLEGDDPQYLKAVACAKHYAVHSGPEHNLGTPSEIITPYKSLRKRFGNSMQIAPLAG